MANQRGRSNTTGTGARSPVPIASIRLTPAFKLVFITVVALTVLSLIVCFILVTRPSAEQSEDAKRLVETCATTFKLGFGAIIGLIGGKAIP
jgi:hypothetical protein